MSTVTSQPNRYLRLLRYAQPYWRGWVAILLVTMLATLFSVVSPWPMKVLVDNVLGHAPLPSSVRTALRWLPASGSNAGMIGWIALAGLFIFAVNSTLDVVLTWLWIRIGQGMVYELAAALFARVQRRSLLFHSRNSVGDSMARVTGDSWAVYSLVDTLWFAPLHAGFTLIVMLVLMLRLNLPLTLLSVAIAPLMTACSLMLGKRLRTTARAQRDIESRIQSHVQQTLTGITVVQAFGQEEREHNRFVKFTVAAMSALRRNTLASSFAGLGTGLTTTLGTAAVLWVGARQVLHGGLSVGSLLVFLTYLGAMQSQLKSFTGIYSTLQTVRAKVDRVCEVLETEPEVSDRPGARALARAVGRVRYENVTFGYTSERAVLKNVSLEAAPGETIALVGPTGAGKSTLVSLVPRFFDPWEGRILLDGRDVRDVQVKSLREQVAIVLQEPFLFPTTIGQNIAYGRPGATMAEIRRAAEAANADSFIRRLPGGYDTELGERGATLSGGERQRLSIARALLKDAPILILDEPTSALDAGTEHLILEALQRLICGRTTFIIAHRLSTIRSADKIAVVEGGQIREEGSHAELQLRGGLYARMVSIQSGICEITGAVV